MRKYRIFAIGGVGSSCDGDLSDCLNVVLWSDKIKEMITTTTDKSIIFNDPYKICVNDYNEFRKLMLNQIMQSDIVIVGLDFCGKDIKTPYYLGIIEALNKVSNRNIFVVGIGSAHKDYPWLYADNFHRENTIEDAAEFITNYLLI